MTMTVSEKIRLKTAFVVYARAMKIFWDTSPKYATLSMFTAIFSAIAVPAQVWVSKVLIDRLAALVTHPLPITGDWMSALSPLFLPLGGYLTIWVVSEFFFAISKSVMNLLTEMTQRYGQYRLVQKAAQLSIAFYENSTYYDQMELARNQVWRFSNASFYVFTFFTQIVTLISLFVLLGSVHWLIPLVMLLVALPKFFIQTVFVNRLAQFMMRNVPNERMIRYLSWLLSARETVKEIHLFGLQEYFLRNYWRSSQQYIDRLAELTLQKERANFLLSIPTLLGTAFAWGFSAVLALVGRISLGDIALVFQSCEGSRTAIEQLFIYAGYGIENVVFLKTYFDFLDLPPDAVPGALSKPKMDQKTIPLDGTLRHGTIEFRGVSFQYPGSAKKVIDNLSFKLPPGTTLALVGENGAGKTTLVKLLARLYDPSEGHILLDGRDLCEYDLEEYYRQIGVIFQDFTRYDLTIYENIGLGWVEEIKNSGRVNQAAQMGGALHLMEGLPHGMETVLGKRFEGGVDLSGGEWQKIALSRAFMREASLLILDEPTAALDAIAEADVYARFAELTCGKTTVFVTHRLSSVKMAQKILVLKDGRLIETGSHTELLARGGEYARMFTLQAERYQ